MVAKVDSVSATSVGACVGTAWAATRSAGNDGVHRESRPVAPGQRVPLAHRERDGDPGSPVGIRYRSAAPRTRSIRVSSLENLRGASERFATASVPRRVLAVPRAMLLAVISISTVS